MRPRVSALPLLLLGLVACAGSRPSAGPIDDGAVAPGCALEMPPARDIETYAGGAEALDPAGRWAASPLLAHSLNRAPIVEVVRAHQPEIRACYEQGLLRDPNLKGRLDVRWTITPETTVRDVELSETTLTDACVVRCVIDEIATWSFPGFRGLQREIRLTYPFRFGPAS